MLFDKVDSDEMGGVMGSGIDQRGGLRAISIPLSPNELFICRLLEKGCARLRINASYLCRAN